MLSSRWTYFLKFIFGPLWILLLGFLALAAVIAPQKVFAGPQGEPPPPGLQWIVVVIWAIGSAGIMRFTMPLKRVELRDGRLSVSNYRRQWELLPHDIHSVRQSRWVNGRPIRVTLRHDVDGLGTNFMFIPPTRAPFFRFWRDDPQVDELHRFAGLINEPSKRVVG
jgi:hypothetical protein